MAALLYAAFVGTAIVFLAGSVPGSLASIGRSQSDRVVGGLATAQPKADATT